MRRAGPKMWFTTTAATRAARCTESESGEDEETDEIEQRARRSHQQTHRVAVHYALRCRNRQIDADPAAESGSRGVKRFTPAQKMMGKKLYR
jgi:hypothetical protein